MGQNGTTNIDTLQEEKLQVKGSRNNSTLEEDR